MSRDGAFSRAQQTKNWCVGFSFPPPAYAGIHPTLYLFGFRANALNSHSPSFLPGFDPGSGEAFGVSDGFWGPPKLSKTFGRLRGLRGPPFCAGLCTLEGLRGPPGASGGLRGAGGLERGVRAQEIGFGSGFRVLFRLPALDPEISAFPGNQGGQWPPRAPRRPPRRQV